MRKTPSILGFRGTGNIVWSIIIMLITGWLSFGPKPIVDSISLAVAPQLIGETPLVVREVHEPDNGMSISPEIISMFASDNGVDNITFLEELFISTTEDVDFALVEDLDGIVRRIRMGDGERAVPPISLSVPSISANQLIQLRPDALGGTSLIMAGEVGETMVDTLSGRFPLWQVYANTISLSNPRTMPPLFSFIVALGLFFFVSVSSSRTILITAVAACMGAASMWHLAWLPPLDPMASAILGGLVVARASHLRSTKATQAAKLSSFELSELNRFSESSVQHHECLAAWVVLMKGSNAPRDEELFSTITSHGDTVEMSEAQISLLITENSSVDSRPKPWSVFPIESARTLTGSLFLITQPNDRHDQKSTADIASMVASFYVTDSVSNDSQES